MTCIVALRHGQTTQARYVCVCVCSCARRRIHQGFHGDAMRIDRVGEVLDTNEREEPALAETPGRLDVAWEAGHGHGVNDPSVVPLCAVRKDDFIG